MFNLIFSTVEIYEECLRWITNETDLKWTAINEQQNSNDSNIFIIFDVRTQLIMYFQTHIFKILRVCYGSIECLLCYHLEEKKIRFFRPEKKSFGTSKNLIRCRVNFLPTVLNIFFAKKYPNAYLLELSCLSITPCQIRKLFFPRKSFYRHWS